jgi:hypothetical protein
MAEGIKGGAPPFRTSSSGPLAEDFARQQELKQQRGNFHSTSLTSSVITMVANAVNKTGLHPAGVQYVLTLAPPPTSSLTTIATDPKGNTQRLRRSSMKRLTLTTTVYLL